MLLLKSVVLIRTSHSLTSHSFKRLASVSLLRRCLHADSCLLKQVIRLRPTVSGCLKPVLVVPCYGFKTTTPRRNPIVAVVLRQVAKFVAIVTGRAVRKWWSKLPANKRQLFVEWLDQQKWRLLGLLGVLITIGWTYYWTHVEDTPITKRQRLMVFNNKQMQQIADYQFQVMIGQLQDKLLPAGDKRTQTVARVANRLLKGNNDLEQIYDHEWSVSVVNEPKVKNAFVYPNGQIFVYTGMLDICDNDEQLGVVLAHEMAHAVLAHTAELASHAHLVDLFFICLLALIWAVLPTDLFSVVITGISRTVMDLMLDKPYNRMLETEADIVGLELAAKACFDVRETSAFWHKMSFIDSAEGFQVTPESVHVPQTPATEWLLTHPSHETRYHYLDSVMDEAVRIRQRCGCTSLPALDPRHVVERMKKAIEEKADQKRKEGIVMLDKPGKRLASGAE